jgi:hypothetical protein
MKIKGIAIVVLMLVFTATGWAQAQQRRQQQLRSPNVAGRPAPIEDVVEGFYVSQFSEFVEVGDEQLSKVLPVLRQALRERREISARRTRSLNQLRIMTERGDSAEELQRMVREVDKADADTLASQQKFVSEVDPLLSARQQAKLRVFQVLIEQRIRRMIDRARR